MIAAINVSKLPVFIVDNKTHVAEIKTDPQLTRLVDAGKSRYSYLVPAPEIDEAAKLALNMLQKKAIAKALDKMVLQIARQLGENPKVGYMVRINRRSSLEGVDILGSELLTAIGFGMEPIDALAESYRIPAYRSAPIGLADTSEYAWYTTTAGRLTCARYDADLSRLLETQAGNEANRRTLSGGVKFDPTSGIARARAAEYWREYAVSRLSAIESLERKTRIAQLNARLQAAQDQFNTAYENYQTSARELTRNAAEMQTLERIGAVINLLKASSSAVDAARKWRSDRATALTSQKEDFRGLADLARGEMVDTQAKIVNEWSTLPTPVWQSPVIPEIDLRIEVIERKGFNDASGGATEVILWKD